METIKAKLGGVMEEYQSAKNAHAEKEMTNLMLKNSLQSLQQKYDTLQKIHEVREMLYQLT